MSSPRPRTLPVLMVGALALVACGGGSDASDGADSEGADQLAADDNDASGDDGADEFTENDVVDELTEPADAGDAPSAPAVDVTDPIYHHASIEASANSYGPMCNPGNVRTWAPGWRISAPEGWTFASSGGSNSFYDLGWETPDGFFVKVDWSESIDSFGFNDGTPVGDIDFDGETVTVMDSSDDTTTILSIDYISQSTGGLVEASGGDVALNQISISVPTEMGMSQNELTTILTSMQRERCAILDALPLENAFQGGAVLPIFDGGDPLGKTPPTSERLPFQAGGALNPFAAYTDDQLAYIVGFDQATSECFVANVRPTVPTEIADFASFVDPVTPNSEEAVAAQQAILANC